MNHFACEHLEQRVTDQKQAWTIYLTQERMKQKNLTPEKHHGKDCEGRPACSSNRRFKMKVAIFGYYTKQTNEVHAFSTSLYSFCHIGKLE